MELVEDSGGGRDVRGTEVDGEIESRGRAVADFRGGGAIEVCVEAEIGRGDRERRQSVHFYVWTCRRLLIHSNGLRDMRAGGVVHSCRANGIVGAVEGHGVVGVATPGEILEGAYDGQDLGVCVWDSVEDGVCACRIAIDATRRESPGLIEDSSR